MGKWLLLGVFAIGILIMVASVRGADRHRRRLRRHLGSSHPDSGMSYNAAYTNIGDLRGGDSGGCGDSGGGGSS